MPDEQHPEQLGNGTPTVLRKPRRCQTSICSLFLRPFHGSLRLKVARVATIALLGAFRSCCRSVMVNC